MKTFAYIKQSYIELMKNRRIYFFLLVMVIFIIKYNRPLYEYCQAMNYPITAYVFPFLMTSLPFICIYYFCVIYANSDIPFMQHTQLYQLIRIGSSRWMNAKIFALFCRSISLVLLTFLISFITLIPHIDFSNEWGKLAYTAVLTSDQITLQFGYIFNEAAFIDFSPLQITLITIVICSLINMYLSLAMFTISLFCNRSIAIAFGAINVVLIFIVNNAHPMIKYQIAKLVPACWIQVAKIHTPDHGYYWLPSVVYMLIFLVVCIGILYMIIHYKVKRIDYILENSY